MESPQITTGASLTPYSPEVRRLLVYFAACDVDRPVPQVTVDWDEALQAIQQHRIVGLAYYLLTQRNQPDYPPPSFQRAIRLLHYRNVRHMTHLYRDLHTVVDQLSQQGIEFMVVKGAAVAHTVYPSPALRDFVDLDLHVREQDRPAIDSIMREIGYDIAEGTTDYLPQMTSQVIALRHTTYRQPGGGLPVEAHWDNFLLDELVMRDLDAISRRAVEVDIDGSAVHVPAAEDHFLHLCAHAHTHRYSRLFWLADLHLLLRRYRASFDWDQLSLTVKLEAAEVPVYYSLKLLAAVFDEEVSAEFLDTIRPDRFRRWCHERFIPQSRTLLWSDDDFPPFSFKSMPLFDSTILNLLVMSRRREKIQFLFRLLIPTRKWLRQRYHLPPGRSVLPFYFLRFMFPAATVERLAAR